MTVSFCCTGGTFFLEAVQIYNWPLKGYDVARLATAAAQLSLITRRPWKYHSLTMAYQSQSHIEWGHCFQTHTDVHTHAFHIESCRSQASSDHLYVYILYVALRLN